MQIVLPTRRIPVLGIVTATAYVGCVYLANWLLLNVGTPAGPIRTIPVWPGVYAPSGVLAAGLALTMRDLTQDRLGRGAVVACIVVGAALSALLSPGLALASGQAFLLSEVADMLVYTPIKKKSWLGAIALSNTVGLAVDSVLFLWLAGIPFVALPGQVIGKLWATIAAITIMAIAQSRWLGKRIQDSFVNTENQ
jgi:uncharacterized PurR-regulated membrane protein YhhQ (DUF165 family)